MGASPKTQKTLRALMLVSATAGGRALAEEPRKATEPLVLAEPTELTQIADAFDENDPFDVNLSLGFQHTAKSASVLRETSSTLPGLTSGGFVSDTLNVAKYSESTSRLLTRAELGLYRDIALVFQLPIILSNSRKLEDLEGSAREQSFVLKGRPGEQLFSLPFEAPTRSGIEHLAVGLEFGIFNQARNPTKPTWTFGLEGQFSVSEPMHPCTEHPSTGQVKCAQLSDIDRDGVASEFFDGQNQLDGDVGGEREPGVSRGTTGFELHSFVSRRIKYIEPYGGFRALFEFPISSSDFELTDLKGSLVNHPPLRGTMIMGMSIMPWEVWERFQRLTLDFRFEGTYVSEGKDYSELYDALGSSSAASIRGPQYADFMQNPDPVTAGEYPSVIDPDSRRVYFSGITDVQQYGSYTLKVNVTWQAGQYVKFNIGTGYTLVQSHFVTSDQACNPDFASDSAKAGPCRSRLGISGIPNPNFRRVINDPGRRFRVDDVNAFDGWVNATVMF